jgi:hypothetical protein
VEWDPSNKIDTTYFGSVMARNPSGMNIYEIPGYEEHRAGRAKEVVSFDRVLVKADHDDKWHAQSLKSLRMSAS